MERVVVLDVAVPHRDSSACLIEAAAVVCAGGDRGLIRPVAGNDRLIDRYRSALGENTAAAARGVVRDHVVGVVVGDRQIERGLVQDRAAPAGGRVVFHVDVNELHRAHVVENTRAVSGGVAADHAPVQRHGFAARVVVEGCAHTVRVAVLVVQELAAVQGKCAIVVDSAIGSFVRVVLDGHIRQSRIARPVVLDDAVCTVIIVFNNGTIHLQRAGIVDDFIGNIPSDGAVLENERAAAFHLESVKRAIITTARAGDPSRFFNAGVDDGQLPAAFDLKHHSTAGDIISVEKALAVSVKRVTVQIKNDVLTIFDYKILVLVLAIIPIWLILPSIIIIFIVKVAIEIVLSLGGGIALHEDGILPACRRAVDGVIKILPGVLVLRRGGFVFRTKRRVLIEDPIRLLQIQVVIRDLHRVKSIVVG